jgi:hypothetical protein
MQTLTFALAHSRPPNFLEEVDDLRCLQVPFADERFAHRLERCIHAPVCSDRGHRRVKDTSSELAEPIELINHEPRNIEILALAISVKAVKPIFYSSSGIT